MKKLMMTGLTAAMLHAGAALAGEVIGYTPPIAGQAATAASVDENFQALIDAIHDNNSRIAALESFDVSDTTFEYREVGFILAAERQGQTITSPGSATAKYEGFARIGIFTASGTLTFTAPNSFSLDLLEYETELWVNPESDMGPMTANSGNEQLGVTGTWSQTGSTVTITIDGDPDPFTAEVSKGASTLTITNQGVGGQVFGSCEQQIINGNANTVEVCLHEWDTSFGVATRSN